MPGALGGLVAAFLATLSIACNYATRSLMPIASHAICHEDAGCVAARLVSESTEAFFVGDLIAQFAAGLLVRHVNGPWLLAVTTAGWALATLLLPAAIQPAPAQSVPRLLQLARGLLCGLGYPAAHAVVATTPPEVRATALGLVNSSAGLGTMLANVIISELLRQHRWALPFYILGVAGLSAAALLGVFAASRQLDFLNHSPPQSQVCEVPPRAKHVGIDYVQWLRHPLVRALVLWMVVVAVSGQTVGGAFLPTLFIERHGVDVSDLALYTGTPPLAQVIVCLGVGLLCDVLVSKAGLSSSHVQARLQLVAVVFPAFSLLALSSLEGCPSIAGFLATIWLGCTSFHSAGALAVLHAVGSQRAGELFALGNAFAKLGALLSASATRWALRALGWQAVLLSVAFSYAASGWLLLPQMARVDEAAAVVGTRVRLKAA